MIGGALPLHLEQHLHACCVVFLPWCERFQELESVAITKDIDLELGCLG